MENTTTYEITGWANDGYFKTIRVEARDLAEATKVGIEQGVYASHIREVSLEEQEQEIINLYESLEIDDLEIDDNFPFPNEFVAEQVAGLLECIEAWPEEFGIKEKAIAFQKEFMEEFQYPENKIQEVLDFLENYL